MKSFLLILILYSYCSAVSGQSLLDKIETLHLQKKDGEIIEYYSPGGEKTAGSLVKLLAKSSTYYQDQFGISENFSIAVLDSADWSEITNVPYGLPFVSGPPYVVCFPSSSENKLSRIIKKSIEGYNLSADYSKTDDDLVRLFTSMIGFHELGHIYAKKYGLNFPNKWTYEFGATYFAYLYLAENYPQEADIWRRISEILVNEIKPVHTLLSDFENLYFRVGIENYAWYQVIFLLKVVETENISGAAFLKKLSGIQLSTSDDNFSLTRMEQIGPGFIKWAEKYNLIK
jgi:hypothetical protein